jgi:hypothetical protein
MATYDRPPIESTWIEPESVANDETKPEYPYNNIQLVKEFVFNMANQKTLLKCTPMVTKL